MKLSKRDAALKAFDCLFMAKDEKKLGMALGEIVDALKLTKLEQASIYFGCKVLVEQGILLYGQNKRGKEKLYTVVDGKDASQADFTNCKEKVQKEKVTTPDETEEVARVKKALREYEKPAILDWMRRNACMYVTADTLANAAAIKHNLFTSKYDIGGNRESSFPEWIMKAARLYMPE
jgi:hypothetical protein